METLSATMQTKTGAEARLRDRAEQALARALAAAILLTEAAECAEDEEMLARALPGMDGHARPTASCLSRAMVAAGFNADVTCGLLESECMPSVRQMANRMLVAARAALGMRG